MNHGVNVRFLMDEVVPRLRSGTIVQGHGCLRQDDGEGSVRQCCLGVIEDAAMTTGHVAGTWVAYRATEEMRSTADAATQETRQGDTGVHVLSHAVAAFVGLGVGGEPTDRAGSAVDYNYDGYGNTALWHLNDRAEETLPAIGDRIAAMCDWAVANGYAREE